jgi:hypothetical protein
MDDEQDNMGPLATEWARLTELLRGNMNDIEIEQFRLMFFHGARIVLLMLATPVNPSARLRQLTAELLAFYKETSPYAKSPAAQGTGEHVGADQAPAA